MADIHPITAVLSALVVLLVSRLLDSPQVNEGADEGTDDATLA